MDLKPAQRTYVMPENKLPYSKIAGVAGLLASVACAWQLWWLVMWGVWGAPPNPLHPVALLGALTLFVSSIVLLSTGRRKAVVVALIGVIPLWVF